MGFNISRAIKNTRKKVKGVADKVIDLHPGPDSIKAPFRKVLDVGEAVNKLNIGSPEYMADLLGKLKTAKVVDLSLSSLTSPKAGEKLLAKVTPGKFTGSSSIMAGLGPSSVNRNARHAVKTMGEALTGRRSLKKGLYEANWYFTQAHPGAGGTKNAIKKAGFDPANLTKEIAAVGGAVGGAWGGKYVGAGVGFLSGWGATSQFAGRDDYKQAYDSGAVGAATGFVVGSASDAMSEGASGTETVKDFSTKYEDAKGAAALFTPPSRPPSLISPALPSARSGLSATVPAADGGAGVPLFLAGIVLALKVL